MTCLLGAVDISNPQPGAPAPWIDQDDHFERTVSQRLGSVKYSRVVLLPLHQLVITIPRPLMLIKTRVVTPDGADLLFLLLQCLGNNFVL